MSQARNYSKIPIFWKFREKKTELPRGVSHVPPPAADRCRNVRRASICWRILNSSSKVTAAANTNENSTRTNLQKWTKINNIMRQFGILGSFFLKKDLQYENYANLCIANIITNPNISRDIVTIITRIRNGNQSIFHASRWWLMKQGISFQ